MTRTFKVLEASDKGGSAVAEGDLVRDHQEHRCRGGGGGIHLILMITSLEIM